MTEIEQIAVAWICFVAFVFVVNVIGFFCEIRERRKEFDKMSPGWRDSR